jgi:hypothetical protein
VDQDRPEDVAARQRDASIVEELRKAELVRDRLEGLQQLVGSYPEGHRTRVLLEDLLPRAGARSGRGGHRGAQGLPPPPRRYLRSRTSDNASSRHLGD